MDHECITTPNVLKLEMVGDLAFLTMDLTAAARDFCTYSIENLNLVNREFLNNLNFTTIKIELETLYANRFALVLQNFRYYV